MLLEGHPAFALPLHNVSLWRYMDFTKYVSYLETQKLAFARADTFNDPYEGMWSKEDVLRCRADKSIDSKNLDFWLTNLLDIRKKTFISCWYANEHESDAMWKLFLKSSEGVAIKTTLASLRSIIRKSPLVAGLSSVGYIDYEKDPVGFGNVFYPYTRKRLSFSHENEVRGIISSQLPENKRLIPDGSTYIGLDAPIDSLIHSIHVSPTAPPWFAELVQQVGKRYGASAPVIQSKLYELPSYHD